MADSGSESLEPFRDSEAEEDDEVDLEVSFPCAPRREKSALRRTLAAPPALRAFTACPVTPLA